MNDKGVMPIEGVQVAMAELKKVKDLKQFKIDGITAFAKKYNITEPQVNFLLSVEAVARHKAQTWLNKNKNDERR